MKVKSYIIFITISADDTKYIINVPLTMLECRICTETADWKNAYSWRLCMSRPLQVQTDTTRSRKDCQVRQRIHDRFARISVKALIITASVQKSSFSIPFACCTDDNATYTFARSSIERGTALLTLMHLTTAKSIEGKAA